MSAFLQLLLIVVCMGGQAFFAGMETGVVSIHRLRLRHFVREGSASAAMLQGFLEHPDRLLGTTLVGTNVFTVTISVVAASLGVQLMGRGGDTVAACVAALMVLVFCEYIPKAWFHERPIERCERFAGLLRTAEIIFKPISSVVVWLSRRLVPGSSDPFAKPVPFVTRDDLKILAHEGERDGVLSPRERFMIHRVFGLSGKRAREIMIPMAHMKYVETDTTIEEFFKSVRQNNLTRMPVYDKETGTFTGVINVFYVLLSGEVDPKRPVTEFLRPPLFVPEDMPVDDIFPRLRRFRQPMCLVRGADSSEVVGLITTEDILEEIVGKL